MSSRQKLADEVRRLRELSLDEGVVSLERVTAVLQALTATRKPHELRPLLRGYFAAMRREVAKGEARVEYAGALSETVKAGLAAHFTKAYGRVINVTARPEPALIAGFRVRIGDDVYDASVAGHLAKLERALA